MAEDEPNLSAESSEAEGSRAATPPQSKTPEAEAENAKNAAGKLDGTLGKAMPYTSVNLSQTVVRALSDRAYEKRKAGAIEIEKVVREKTNGGNGGGEDYVVTLINILTMDYACSINSNQRKGGLIGLAAVSLGLGAAGTPKFLQYLLPPVLKCFDDPEVRVRYYACEALYNIAKVARQHVLAYFNALFDGLCKLFADVDVDVKNGAQLLDRLVKEIVTENCDKFQVDVFIPLLEKYLKMTNPYIRQFLLGWILALDSVPEIDMVVHLPKFLEGIFNMLGDGNREIRQQSDMALGQFLSEIQEQANSKLDERHIVAIVSIIVVQSSSTQKFNRLTAVSWIEQFIDLFGERLALMYSGILGVLLNSLGDSESEIKVVADRAHDKFLELVRSSETDFALRPVISIVSQKLAVPILQDEKDPNWISKDDLAAGRSGQINRPSFSTPQATNRRRAQVASPGPGVGNGGSNSGETGPGGNGSTPAPLPTRLAALRWISMLLDKFPTDMEEHLGKLSPAMLSALSDPSDELVVLDLDVLARIARNTSRMDQVIGQVIKLFKSDRSLFDSRGSFIIRKLCVLLEASTVYLILANEIEREKDIDFAHLMVQALNLILLTAPELNRLRGVLRSSKRSNEGRMDSSLGGLEVFVKLFKTWSVDPVATLSLCLLSEFYELSSRLVIELAGVNLTVGFLMEVDKLVQLLESPAFLTLRLELVNVEGKNRPPLLKTLYGLLMILPQSGAYTTLSNRLNAAASLQQAIHSHSDVPHIPPVIASASSPTNPPKKKIFSSLINSSGSNQNLHQHQQNTAGDTPEMKVSQPRVEDELLQHFVGAQTKIVDSFEHMVHAKSLFQR